MPFYLRKSLKLGPLRLNFSKHGVGASVGVKGARLGVDATGREYVHAGRYGLYYRERGAKVAASGAGFLVWLTLGVMGVLVMLAIVAQLTG